MNTVQILEKEGSNVSISQDVVTKLVEQIINEIDGATLFTVEYNALTELVSKNNPFAKAIKIDFLEDSISVSLNISVKFGEKIQEVAESIQDKISQDIQSFTGISVMSVNVTVVNVN